MYRIILLTLLFFTWFGCKRVEPQLPETAKTKDLTAENLLSMNIALAETERLVIDSFIRQSTLPFHSTPYGIWLSVDTLSVERQLKKGQIVEVSYSVRLLDGTILYPSETKQLMIGRSDETQGLDIALTLIGCGKGEVDAIIPANLSYGTIGDGHRIGSKKTLHYTFHHIQILHP